MIMYLFVAIWPLLIKYIRKTRVMCIGRRKLGDNFFIIISLLPMFLTIGLRGINMGADTGTYLRNFLYVSETPIETVIENSRMEAGYLLFVKFIGTYITKDVLMFQLIYTSIYFIGIFVFIKELEDNWSEFIFFVITLGLYTFMFTGVRQCLAMSICLISFRFVSRKKLILFLGCIALAYTFHHSAALFVVTYLIAYREIKWYNIAIYGGMTYVVTNNLQSVQNWLNSQLDYIYGIEETGSGQIFLALHLLLVVFSVFFLHNYKKINVKTKPLINLCFISLFFWIIRLKTRVAERPGYYFLFFACACFAYGINVEKDRRQRVIYKLLIMGIALLLYLYRFSNSFSSLVPYQMFGG